MDKQKFFTILYVALIISLILFMAYMVFWLQTDGASCMKAPLEYVSQKTGEQCYCMGMKYGGWGLP